MSFSFSNTAGTSQSNVKPQLEGNKIHEVKLGLVESEDIAGVKDPSKTYKVIKINYDGEDGSYEHTVWEPRPEDFDRRETEYTDRKTGKPAKMKHPSNVETMMLLFKHNIDAFVPEVAKKIDSGEANLVAKDWDGLRALVVKILTSGKGRQSKLKLSLTKDGKPTIPFFSNLTKDGTAYINNNFIGDKVAFTAYEMQEITKAEKAKPIAMNINSEVNIGNDDIEDVDLELDLDSL